MIKIMKYGVVSDDEIFSRSSSSRDVSDIVSGIIKDVQSRGDEALREYSKKFDGADISTLEQGFSMTGPVLSSLHLNLFCLLHPQKEYRRRREYSPLLYISILRL